MESWISSSEVECGMKTAGSWNLSQGAELQWSPGDKWNTIVEIPAGAILEYKYVLLEGDGIRSVAWQNGNNNVLAVGHSDDNVEVRPCCVEMPCGECGALRQGESDRGDEGEAHCVPLSSLAHHTFSFLPLLIRPPEGEVGAAVRR